MKDHNPRNRTQAGSVVSYVLLAVFLAGILIMAVTEGPQKNAMTQQLDEIGVLLAGDILVAESAVNDCVLMYSAPIDRDADGDRDTTDNPNAPFPLIYNATTGYAMTGTMAEAVCPGTAPTPLTPPTAASNQQKLMGGTSKRYFQLLGDTSRYTATFVTDTTEGVYLRITRATSNSLWTEAITRLNTQYSTCKAAVVTAAGVCANGCFYYWFKRLPTTAIGIEAGCP